YVTAAAGLSYIDRHPLICRSTGPAKSNSFSLFSFSRMTREESRATRYLEAAVTRNSKKLIALATVLFSFLFQTAAFAANDSAGLVQRLKQQFPLAARALDLDHQMPSRARVSAVRESERESLALESGN